MLALRYITLHCSAVSTNRHLMRRFLQERRQPTPQHRSVTPPFSTPLTHRATAPPRLRYHPDKAGGSTQAFHLIKQAYDTLTDTDKRRAYDEGADVNKGKDQDSDEEGEGQSLREEVERKYFPERYDTLTIHHK